MSGDSVLSPLASPRRSNSAAAASPVAGRRSPVAGRQTQTQVAASGSQGALLLALN